MAAILNFPTKKWTKKMETVFSQFFMVNINEKTQLFKIYMKKSQNMYLLHNSVYYDRCFSSRDNGGISGVLCRFTTKSRQQYVTLFLIRLYQQYRERQSVFLLPFETTRQLKQWSSGFVEIDCHRRSANARQPGWIDLTIYFTFTLLTAFPRAK